MNLERKRDFEEKKKLKKTMSKQLSYLDCRNVSYARRGSIRVQCVAQRGKHDRPLSHEFTLQHTGHPQDRIHLESRHDSPQAFCHVSMRHRGHRVLSEHRRSLQDHLRRD